MLQVTRRIRGWWPFLMSGRSHSAFPSRRSHAPDLVLETLEGRVLLSFLPAVNYDAGRGTWSVAAGDFNGDRKLDLVTANYYSSTVGVLLGNGDGTFGPPKNYGVGGNPVAVAVGHFRGPQFPLDVVTA